ncbi:restriction endonuclease subunit S [Bacillus cereus group sp. TH204-1LC]|uniref:restriction endonuclease subunit S n=1 Tax=Bacillus cereus group TaxID=86661 RepID=UPI0022E94751|nr:restriction endonuclease subunit S [Bacillus cereus group sp. TH204-1LC]MDA1620366.1 restriction endonuclease subunit S [Bacillus cereus group sp. TH204-1LC]
MTVMKIGEITQIKSGYAFQSKCFNEEERGMPLIRIRDVGKNNPKTYYEGDYSEEYIVKKGDFLISMDGEFKISQWKGKTALLNQRVCRIEANERFIDSKYMYYFLPRELQKIEDTTSFVTVKHLSVKQIRDIEVSLPPIEEQKKIVAVLDKAQSLIEKRKEVLVKLEEALQSFYLTTVGSGAKNYRQWEKKKIEDLSLAEKGSMRTGPFGSDLKHSEFVNEGIAVLGIDNAVNNRFSWGERRFITEEKYNQLKRYTVKPKDVIITIMGTTGRSAVVPDDIPLAITTKHLATITLNDKVALPEFISFSIHSNQYILKQIQKANKGAIMNGLNLGIIKKLEIYLPPMNEQKKFLDFYSNYQSLQYNLTKSLVTLEDNFNSLLQHAFKGELKINV